MAEATAQRMTATNRSKRYRRPRGLSSKNGTYRRTATSRVKGDGNKIQLYSIDGPHRVRQDDDRSESGQYDDYYRFRRFSRGDRVAAALRAQSARAREIPLRSARPRPRGGTDDHERLKSSHADRRVSLEQRPKTLAQRERCDKERAVVKILIAYTAEIREVMSLKSYAAVVVNYNARRRERRGARLNSTYRKVAFASEDKRRAKFKNHRNRSYIK